jgi:transcriptional regulator with GAF, ATPase, and Fis domain
MAERKLTTDITFKGEAKAFTTFILEPLECSGEQTMRFILDDSDYEGECQEAECTLSLDELEYLAHRILDVVDYQRRVVKTYNGYVDDEYANIVTALVNNRGDRTKAASELSMSVRTLYRKIKEYELDTRLGL